MGTRSGSALSVRRSKKSFVNLSRKRDDVGDTPASTSLGGVEFECFERLELLRPNEKREEGAIVDVGENLEVLTGISMWLGGTIERCSRNLELIVNGVRGCKRE